MTMTGRKPIVCRLQNNHFHEHPDVATAQTEAERLARSIGGEFVVYVPAVSVKRVDIVVENLAPPSPCRPEDEGDDYPF